MTPDIIQEAFALIQYVRDGRRSPDEQRRGQFRSGWEDATKRGKVYTPDQRPEQIDEAFKIPADLYRSPLGINGVSAHQANSDVVNCFDYGSPLGNSGAPVDGMRT
jgi:hypothetical protein